MAVLWALLLGAALWIPPAHAACTCQCVNGSMQPLCDSAIGIPPICPQVVCPIGMPGIAPIQSPVIPPIGTSGCRQAQVCDPYGNCRFQSVCR